MNGSNLEIGYTNSSGDKITVQGQTNASNAIERLELSNGHYLSSSDINQVISDMAAYASSHSISFSSLDDVKNDSNLMAIINGAWQS